MPRGHAYFRKVRVHLKYCDRYPEGRMGRDREVGRPLRIRLG